MYVCMYVCSFANVYVCMYGLRLLIFVGAYSDPIMYLLAYMKFHSVHPAGREGTDVSMYVCMYVCVYIFVCKNMCMHI